MKIDSAVIAKYNKIWMLAQRGEENEAKNAQRILENMQRHHSGIDQKAKETREKEAKQEQELQEDPELDDMIRRQMLEHMKKTGFWEDKIKAQEELVKLDIRKEILNTTLSVADSKSSSSSSSSSTENI